MKISVIIPALNEASELPETIARAEGAEEIILVDGGSSDGTREVRGVKVVMATKGRASQMNAGAQVAAGEVLLFLHADTWLQAGALENLRGAMSDRAIVGGAFVRRFRNGSIFLRLSCAAARARNEVVGWHLGDQAMFCRASVFRELGGFRSMKAFEDVDFSRRLRARGKIVTLTPAVLSSARRFEEGAIRRTAQDLVLTARYLLRPETFFM